jgi:hypothetical protein
MCRCKTGCEGGGGEEGGWSEAKEIARKAEQEVARKSAEADDGTFTRRSEMDPADEIYAEQTLCGANRYNRFA